MAADPINIVNTLRAVLYDGTNSGDIVALDEFNFNNSSESGGVWSFQSPPDSSSFTINTGEWIVYAQNQVLSRASDTEFQSFYRCNALCADVQALESLASAPKVQAMGVAPVPTLLLSGTANINVTLQPAMADDTYDAYAHKFAGISLTDLQINSVTVVDEDTVTVAVENIGLLTIAGASVMVHAVA